jgi:methionine--tRNA ligase beta chain
MSSITFSDFQKLDIHIGTVISAEKVPDADKLIKLVFDLGSEQRQIIAGIAEQFPGPSTLIGQQLPVLVNLEPKTLRGHQSQGMILAADVDGRPVLLHPAETVPPGSIVR